jgi:amidase
MPTPDEPSAPRGSAAAPVPGPAPEWGVSDIARALASGAATSVEVVEALVARMDAVDTGPAGLRSVLARAPEALADARRRDEERAAGAGLGALHGVPVLVKDNVEAVGLPGTAGSLALLGRTVAKDAPLVSRLRAAGAIVVGATNLSEWANLRSPNSASGWSAVGGLTLNPWAGDRSAGGSSSGSGVAVAARLAPVAIGTETNGSITCPAALNGVVGIKPTVGSVPGAGIVPVSVTQDVAGPLARSVRDAALVLEVLAGATGLESVAVPGHAAALRVGRALAWDTGQEAVDALVAEVLDALGARLAVSPATVPPVEEQVGADQVTALVGDLADDLTAYLAGRPGPGVSSLADVVAFNEAHAAEELAYFGQEYFEAALASGGRASDAHRTARTRNVAWAQAAVAALLDGSLTALAAPAYGVAWRTRLGEPLTEDDGLAGGTICMAAAILGLPIVTVPVGTVDGLPVAVSLVGRAGAEAPLIAIAAEVEALVDLTLRPPVA